MIKLNTIVDILRQGWETSMVDWVSSRTVEKTWKKVEGFFQVLTMVFSEFNHRFFHLKIL